MVRKRAPGGGRKPKGPVAARLVAVRMPDDLRAELEAAVNRKQKRRKWTLTDELLWRLRVSFNREHEQRRDPATADWCDLIAELARWAHLGHPNWDRDPYWFRTFKLAVFGLLGALEPPGEIKLPKILDDDFGEWPPERQADVAVGRLLLELRSPPSREDAEATARAASLYHKGDPNYFAERMDNFDREQRTFSRLRRNLQLTFKRKKED
jgi:hypothetical protein